MRSLIIAAALTLGASLAPAQTVPIVAYPPRDDTVTISLNLEDWVQTQTARTEVSVDAALPGSDAGKVRGEMLDAIKTLAQSVEWRFTGFDHDQDASGLERWHATLETRLSETQVGGLSDRAKQASKPGMRINVEAVEFTPTLAEIEAGKAKLRGDMYKKINESLAQLNQAEPDRKFRIRQIAFDGAIPLGERGLEEVVVTAARRAKTQDGSTPDSITRSERLEMSATVTFAAMAPRE